LQVALDLNRRIHQEFVFDPRATSVSTPVETVLSERRGVCQDFAHLRVACLRAGGLAARYVSGYILTEPPPGQPRLVGADASHAWVSVYCPMQGWVDLDPTNNLTVGDDVIAGAATKIMNSAPAGRVLLGYPAVKMDKNIELQKAVRRLPRLSQRVAALEDRLGAPPSAEEE
jgi:hypothetical protein